MPGLRRVGQGAQGGRVMSNLYDTDWSKPDYFHLGDDAEPELRDRLAQLPCLDEAEEE